MYLSWTQNHSDIWHCHTFVLDEPQKCFDWGFLLLNSPGHSSLIEMAIVRGELCETSVSVIWACPCLMYIQGRATKRYVSLFLSELSTVVNVRYQTTEGVSQVRYKARLSFLTTPKQVESVHQWSGERNCEAMASQFDPSFRTCNRVKRWMSYHLFEIDLYHGMYAFSSCVNRIKQLILMLSQTATGAWILFLYSITVSSTTHEALQYFVPFVNGHPE